MHRSGRDSVDHPRNGSDDLANSLAGCLYVALNDVHRPRARIGTYNTSGFVTWQDEEERPRLRIVRVSEAEAIRQKEAGEW